MTTTRTTGHNTKPSRLNPFFSGAPAVPEIA